MKYLRIIDINIKIENKKKNKTNIMELVEYIYKSIFCCL
jgi:hypothetical protein